MRTVASSLRVDSTDFAIRSPASDSNSSINSFKTLAPLVRRHDGADPLSADDPIYVRFVRHVEDVDREVVVHAERQRRRIHHPEAAFDRFAVGDRRQELGVGDLGGIGVVDPFDAVLGHQDRLGVDLECPQRRGRVGREERVAGAGREDHDPTLLEVTHRAAADVGLGDLADLDRGQDPGVGPCFSSASCRVSALSTVASIPM